MLQMTNKCVAGSLIGVVFVSGFIFGTITSEHYTLPYILKSSFRNNNTNATTTPGADGWVYSATSKTSSVQNPSFENDNISVVSTAHANTGLSSTTNKSVPGLEPASGNDSARDVPSSAHTDAGLYASTNNTFHVHSICANITTPRVGPNEDKWQPLSPTSNRVFMYSAFLEDNQVLILGITDRPIFQATCQLWYRHVANTTVYMLTSPARMARIPGGEKQKFRTWYFQCAVHHTWSPFAVSILERSDVCVSPSNVFHVYQPRSDSDTMFNFTICVPPVRGTYPTVQRLVEWIEMNRLLGVQFFTFYNESIHEGVEQIFRTYEKQGILEILHWNRPDVEVHYGAQVASMHDCLNRNQQRNSRFSSFLDLDEMIIPHKPDEFTWEDMLNKLPFACSYSFKCSFFPGNYTKPGVRDDARFNTNRSYVLNNLMRSERIFIHQDRSKMIVRPIEIQFIGTHLTYACTRLQRPMYLDANVGMLHHYRNTSENFSLIRDTTTLKYRSLIDERLRHLNY